MTDSYYHALLIEGRAKQMQELADLAAQDRTPAKARQFAAKARTILRNIAELDEKISASDETGLYSDDGEINVSIVKFLTKLDRPATKAEIMEGLVDGRCRGYKDERMLAIRVARCILSYTLGKPSENPKLKVKRDLIGLPGWPDKKFQQP